MPELPEVEITRRGIAPALLGRRVTAARVREPRLRYPVDRTLAQELAGRCLHAVRRRGKYLLLEFDGGTLLIHLGMSGSLRLVPSGTAAARHEHLDIEFGTTALRLRDPRRFGAVIWETGDIDAHPLIARLGIEPLDATLDAEWLYRASRGRSLPVKQFLMDASVIVGIGNIYASESLFRAGLRPTRAAGRLTRAHCARLVGAIRDTLDAALAAGGSSLRDFVHSDGSAGYFQQSYYAYGRAGEPCRVCAQPIRAIRQGQRSTFYCAHCQL